MQDTTFDSTAMDAKVSELQSIIQLFDQKAIFTAAVAGIILAATEQTSDVANILLQLFLLGSVLASVIAVWPRTTTYYGDRSWVQLYGGDADTILHTYTTAMDQNDKSKAKQIYNLSRICRQKNSTIRVSQALLILACLSYCYTITIT